MATEKRLIDANDFNNSPAFLCGGLPGDLYYDGYCDALDRVQEVLKQFPTVDAVEVVHGHWINWGKSETPTYENYGTCSICHEDAEICTKNRNYCPNCGAKMDEETKFVGICERCEYRYECDWPKLHPKIKLKECPDFNEGEKNKNG